MNKALGYGSTTSIDDETGQFDADVADYEMASPYEEAFDFVLKNKSASSAIGMAKLILSLYNPIHSFGIAECAWNFDRERSALASRVIARYLENGEDEEFRSVGYEILMRFPHLMELSEAADEAKNAVRRMWKAQDGAKQDNPQD